MCDIVSHPTAGGRGGHGGGAAPGLVRADADLGADPRGAARSGRRRHHAVRHRAHPGDLVPAQRPRRLDPQPARGGGPGVSATGLEVRGLTKRFGGLVAVSRFDLTVAPGEIVGLIGPNGAGKTTVFHLVAGFYPPTEGSIAFEGTSLVGLKPHAICRLGLARTFQLVQPFAGLTTLENVMVGAFNRAPDVAQARRRAAELVEFVRL